MRTQEPGKSSAEGEARRPARRAGAAPAAPPEALLALQRTAGNAAVLQLLRRAGHPGAQAREQIREQEQEQHRHGDGCGHGRAERAERTDPAAQAPVPVQRSTVHDVLRSGGSPLDEATRTDMEARLGADFSDVRLHTGAAARRSAAEIGARAYTSGSHVVIGDGGDDRHTLAHELTHVIQQRRGPVAGTDDGSGLSVSDPSDRFEREAEANAHRVLSGPAPAGAVPAQRSTAAPARDVVQRRSDNPHAKPNSHQGWDTTAHHVIAHSTLAKALESLTTDQRKEVLIAAVPSEITEEMLKNLKVTVPAGEDGRAFRKRLRRRLVDPTTPDDATESEILLREIRASFYEWQGGNQFVGPNTSIRAEPSDAKDDIDYDGRFLSPLGEKDFNELTSLGEQLKDPAKRPIRKPPEQREKILEERKKETPKERSEREREETAEILKKILAITRNAEVADFDPAKWSEVETAQDVDRLAEDTKLNRAHISGYTFFKFAEADLKAGRHRYFAADGRTYTFHGVPVTGAQERGGYVYVPYLGARDVVAPGDGETLFANCERNKIPTSTYLPKGLYSPKGRG
ncbi:DUF4157 domain-containing protein [Streptomyces sp. NPDC088757]|uniref:eCIS core domain-containing protein n=1 Tax=Streptomyces sp. NPDC088757 TaxID=3365889 RepID=UPI0038007295